eukprot:353060-Rhodomonas_salina.6
MTCVVLKNRIVPTCGSLERFPHPCTHKGGVRWPGFRIRMARACPSSRLVNYAPTRISGTGIGYVPTRILVPTMVCAYAYPHGCIDSGEWYCLSLPARAARALGTRRGRRGQRGPTGER